jgi:ribonuclease HI
MEKWPDAQLFTDSQAVTNGLSGWSETWKIGKKDIWGRSIWIDLFEGA